MTTTNLESTSDARRPGPQRHQHRSSACSTTPHGSAAISFGAPLLGLLMAIGGVFGVGGGALISQLLGA